MFTTTKIIQPLGRFVRYASKSSKPKINIGVLDVPFDKGQQKRGVNKGPQFLRDAGLIESLKDLRKNYHHFLN